jgi:hypothetical protein
VARKAVSYFTGKMQTEDSWQEGVRKVFGLRTEVEIRAGGINMMRSLMTLAP